MIITQQLKKAIAAKVVERKAMFTGSDAAYARSLGIDKAQYSRIKNGDIDGVLAENMWITLARKFDVTLQGELEWKTARTDVFESITAQLDACQRQSMAGLLCDIAGIGKTYAAKEYVKGNKNAKYVDCSQHKTRRKLIKFIAKEYGVNSTGTYDDIYRDLVFYLRTLSTPLIILDEVGDLKYEAFLEIKALWNATEHCCGWYMMGADGLKQKISRALDNSKVGYAEIFDRYGKKYQRVSPLGEKELQHYVRRQAALIIKANAPEGADMQTLVTLCGDSLRRIYTEVQKFKYLESGDE